MAANNVPPHAQTLGVIVQNSIADGIVQAFHPDQLEKKVQEGQLKQVTQLPISGISKTIGGHIGLTEKMVCTVQGKDRHEFEKRIYDALSRSINGRTIMRQKVYSAGMVVYLPSGKRASREELDKSPGILFNYGADDLHFVIHTQQEADSIREKRQAKNSQEGKRKRTRARIVKHDTNRTLQQQTVNELLLLAMVEATKY
jgi:hypothetical protein